MKKYNPFNKWWFTIILIPTIIFVFNFINNKSNATIGAWFTILVIAICMQIFYIIKYKISDYLLHFLYILIAMNISMFLGYGISVLTPIKESLENQMWDILASLILSIIIGLVSFVVKQVIWYLLLYKFKKE